SLAQMTEHQRCRENHSDRVGNVLTGNVRGSSVHRFKNRVAPSEVGARNDTETADEAGTEIRDDVTIKIFQQQDVELTRLQDELHTRIVDNHLAVLDTRMASGHALGAREKQSVRELHDVCLVDRRDRPPPVLLRVLEGELSDTVRGAGRDDLHRFHDPRSYLVLDSG